MVFASMDRNAPCRDNLKTGEFVKKGQVVALTGNSGLSCGPHLHYEVRYNGINLNPEPFVTWGLKNYETIFKKEKKVKWESLIDLVNQRLIHSIQPSLLMAQK
ncbi:MAG: M23 family metallopeptidase [Deltaproteobacteria bacterium]|nr:M23 family metallopeptidase [Deltaproteobacteria bacterium]